MMLHLYIAQKDWPIYGRTIEFNTHRYFSSRGFKRRAVRHFSYLMQIAFTIHINTYDKQIYILENTHGHILKKNFL